MSNILRKEVISIYRQLLKRSYEWPRFAQDEPNKSLGSAIFHKSREAMRKNRNETDPEKVQQLIDYGKKQIYYLDTLLDSQYSKMYPLSRDYKLEPKKFSFLSALFKY
eukprot:gb/GECH01002892.1/.p1 GENE.gb/GECH01002892.1/~~gb/GECH01002892.1/.p1  ORF type:complete len:108 (+),score=13.38 gb/GECH01002892.1/:1-324(+)